MADPAASAPPPGAPYPPQQAAYPAEQPGQVAYPPQQQYPQATYPDGAQQQPPPGAPQQQPPPGAPQPAAAAYPPQQAAAPYPAQVQPQPQPAAYPPQQAPQAAYPPQQQQQAYPQPQPGYAANPYPQQGAAPPPYYPEQQMEQRVETQVVVEQPAVQYVAQQRVYGTGDHGLIYAIIATVAVLFCCFYFGLICTIPAIAISIGAQDASRRGNDAHARNQSQISYILSSVALGFIVAFWLIVIISAAVR